ncbi:hypothetical protein J2T18_001871 [Paenibacillus polymyxa]|nr:hypothetical protein [Paenibacillus polymyxa]
MPLKPIDLLTVPVQPKIYSIVNSTAPFYNDAKTQYSMVSRRESEKLTIEVIVHVHHDKRRNKSLFKQNRNS